MFTRTTGWLIVPIWLIAMGWLVAHDVWPAWTAQEPPRLRPTRWLEREGKQAQFTILLDNARIGTIWTTYFVSPRSIQRSDLIWIQRFPIDITPLRIYVDSVFDGEGLLDELTVKLANHTTEMRLHGERFHADFSFSFQMGTMERLFKVPLVDGGLIADAFSPFSQLADLHVGKTWRMQVFNPIAVLTGVGDHFIPMLIRVTGQERISTAFGDQDCLIVESPNTRAWVDSRGVVLVQEMTLPVPAGRIRIVRELEFDEDAMMAVRKIRLAMAVLKP